MSMSLLNRIVNVFRGERLNRELDEELQSHLEEATELGRSAEEARLAFGSALRAREASRDYKVVAWLDALKADAVFGWRQLLKNRVATGAAVASLALAMGACVSAFRLVDALLWRPLPVESPERLLFLTYSNRDAKVDWGDSFEYPHFRRLREAVREEAELMAISYASRIDITYGSDQEMEKAQRQYVSGWMFPTFGLRPVLGRLLTAADDAKPGAHPQAVLSHDYWRRRFGGDPKILGRTFRAGNDSYEIVGVVESGFTGTETGTLTDIFVPTMMNKRAIEEVGWSWFRIWAQMRPGASEERARQKLEAAMRAFRREKSLNFKDVPQAFTDQYVSAPLRLDPAGSGVSGLQKDYRHSLAILGALAALALLTACFNIANLMTAQAAARAREMALRVSIGAGRRRLVQLVLVESAMVAGAASVLGGLLAWRAAPFVVAAVRAGDNPAQLILPADWRVLGFAALLALAVTCLFGLLPALRASAVRPVSALKGGEGHAGRQRVMKLLVAAQVTFCFLVHFVAGLFVATFDRLSHQPVGFSPERLLVLDTGAKTPQPRQAWDEVAGQLAAVGGVESAALSGWPLLSGNGWSTYILVNGALREDINPYFLGVSPGWLKTMRIPFTQGRDFRPDERQPSVAIVNESFARTFYGGESAVGKFFEKPEGVGKNQRRVRIEIVGMVRDARYRNMREAIMPTAYLPFHGETDPNWGSFLVRTTIDDPMALAQTLRAVVNRTRPEFRVSNVVTQTDLIEMHTVRERLLAMLALFFAGVTLLLAAVGLFGVLNYSVQQRRREIGIRMALGARGAHLARRLTLEVLAMVSAGAAAGLAAGIGSERYLQTLLYQVKVTDTAMLATPLLAIFAAALLASLPPVIRAMRVDPVAMLRAE
jgi:predicted permease